MGIKASDGKPKIPDSAVKPFQCHILSYIVEKPADVYISKAFFRAGNFFEIFHKTASQITPHYRVLVRKEGNTDFRRWQRGGVMMKPCSFEDSIRLQFNTLFKKVVDMTVQTFQVLDKYELGIVSFDVYGMEVRVADEELSEALMKLSERKRNIILMFYFLEMSDIEIGGILHISRRSSHRNRMSTLEELRNYLQEE